METDVGVRELLQLWSAHTGETHEDWLGMYGGVTGWMGRVHLSKDWEGYHCSYQTKTTNHIC